MDMKQMEAAIGIKSERNEMEAEENTDEIFLGSRLDISLENLKDSIDLMMETDNEDLQQIFKTTELKKEDGVTVAAETVAVAEEKDEETKDDVDEEEAADETIKTAESDLKTNDAGGNNAKRLRRKSQGTKELRNLLASMGEANLDLVEPGQKRKKSAVAAVTTAATATANETGDGAESSKRRKLRDAVVETTQQSQTAAPVASSSNGKEKDRKDAFCWQCHKDGTVVSCQLCPRSFHQRCIGYQYSNQSKITCPECLQIAQAENSRSRSVSLRSVSVAQLAQLLELTLTKIVQCDGSDPFLSPVDELEFPDYADYIVNPMDISQLKRNITDNKYASTDAFLADVKWILHNSIIFNSVHSKITSYAKNIIKLCKQELSEIRNCAECYLRVAGPNPSSKWFEEACNQPHLLLWAKLKSYPYWPAKKIFANQNYVDVRFFGAHDRAWVPVKDCYLFSEKNPNKKSMTSSPSTATYTDDFNRCLQEVERHIKKLEEKFGGFSYAPFQKLYDFANEEQQLRIMLPKYTDSSANSKASATTAGKQTGSPRSLRRTRRTTENAMEGYGTEEDEDEVQKNQQAGLNIEVRQKIGLFADNNGNDSTDSFVSEQVPKKVGGNEVTSFIKTEVLSDGEAENEPQPEPQQQQRFICPKVTTAVTTIVTTTSTITTTTPAQKALRFVNMTVTPQPTNSKKKPSEFQQMVATATTATTATITTPVARPKPIPIASAAHKPLNPTTKTTLLIPCTVSAATASSLKIDSGGTGPGKGPNSKHFSKPIPILINPKGMNKVSTFNIINSGGSNGGGGGGGGGGAGSGGATGGFEQHQMVGSMMLPVQRTNMWPNRMRPLAPAPKMFQLTHPSKSSATLANFPPNKLLVTNPPRHHHQQQQQQQQQQPQQPDDKLPRFATDSHPVSASGSLQTELPRKIQNFIDNKFPTPPVPKTVQQQPPGGASASASAPNASASAILQNSSIAKIVELTTQKMNDYFKSLIVDISKELNEKQGGANDILVRNFEQEMDKMRRQHAEQMAQVKENALLTLNEMQKLAKMDKVITVENLRYRYEQEKLCAIAETKTKQWCAYCQHEAQFYCCWNTSYCDYPCQKKHWDVHSKTCKQSKELLVADEAEETTRATETIQAQMQGDNNEQRTTTSAD